MSEEKVDLKKVSRYIVIAIGIVLIFGGILSSSGPPEYVSIEIELRDIETNELISPTELVLVVFLIHSDGISHQEYDRIESYYATNFGFKLRDDFEYRFHVISDVYIVEYFELSLDEHQTFFLTKE